jgi:hypothetical protein
MVGRGWLGREGLGTGGWFRPKPPLVTVGPLFRQLLAASAARTAATS